MKMDCMSLSIKSPNPRITRARSSYRAGQLSHSTEILLEQHKISIRSRFTKRDLGEPVEAEKGD